jgi:phosphoglucomutase
MRLAELRVVVDPVYGAGRGYVDTFLRRAGCQVTALHTERDPYFGGQRPEPAEDVLQALSATVVREGAALGVATDGDADRFGIIDADGTFVQPNHVLALLLDYLIDTRGWSGGVARSVATTHLLDAVARKHGREVYETPVGFKFIGDLLHRGKIVLGGEESAGLSIQGHVPEKDGILACVLVAEMVARRGQTLRQMLDHLFRDQE